jgi:hypothetical protein
MVRMPTASKSCRTTCDKEGAEIDDLRLPPTPRNRPNPASLDRIRCRAATTRGRRVRRPAEPGQWPPPLGMGPRRLERHEHEEGARAPPSPSSSTSRVVPEADSDGGRVGEQGRRAAVARVLVPLSRPSEVTRG